MAALAENDRLSGPFLATAGQADFPGDFPVLKTEGLVLRIERGGEVLERQGAEIAVTAQSEAGFTVTLTTPCEEGDRVWVYSRLPAERRRAHTPHGAVRTQTLEGDAEEFQGQLQEVQRDLGRSLRFPLGEDPGDFPLRDQRRETIPFFDIEGDLLSLPAPMVISMLGVPFDDDGPWGDHGDPLTHDDGVFA